MLKMHLFKCVHIKCFNFRNHFGLNLMNIKAKLKMNFFIKKEGNSNKKYPNWCMCFDLKNSILSMYVLGLYQ